MSGNGGFFQLSTLISQKPETDIPRCGRCGIYKNKTCQSPKLQSRAMGDLLFIGNPPSKAEDEVGKWMAGNSADVLREILSQNGSPTYSYIGSLICHPNNLKKPLRPLGEHLRDCRPNLFNQVLLQKPKVVVLLGEIPIRAFLGGIWKKDLGHKDLSKWYGWTIPLPKYKTFVIPTYSLVELQEGFNKVRDNLFVQHIRRAIQLCHNGDLEYHEMMSRHKELNKLRSQIEVLYKPEIINERIRDLMKSPVTSFDYETRSAKPEYKGASIVSASISNGKETIAFPFGTKVDKAFFEYLRKKNCKKVGANIKFENRMSDYYYGFKRKSVVRGWALDTMLLAHHYDCRRGITGLKFQAFVQLGVVAYDDDVSSFLVPKPGKHINRVLEDVDFEKLLIYNGEDSLYEYHLAVKLAKMTGLYGSVWRD